MAIRNVFIVDNSENFFKKIDIEFKWFPGFAVSQKQKSIDDLHENFKEKYKGKNPLEISSKSRDDLGINLSAFNLMINTPKGKEYSVECAFQSSKVFENGGPYKDILYMTSRDAKKDKRLKESGKLIRFEFYNVVWELEPKTLFYDWLYINALYKKKALAAEVLKFDAFTDIEFNSMKSVNCQAGSVALFVSLSRKGLLEKAIVNPLNYKNIILTKHTDNQQMNFLD
ncbi:hypothetical protein KPL37_19205 [Clostridium frigoris]|uniref:Uncharacterized protein n=1 Tax=Clostridium frigoris TaxID=205327 RepID=A0ABS6BYW2_9CLOT|nr:hypothetical protein [Clostridium frigoris]MBU3161814.1 hypothetical protein [Clostridium frigoris]